MLVVKQEAISIDFLVIGPTIFITLSMAMEKQHEIAQPDTLSLLCPKVTLLREFALIYFDIGAPGRTRIVESASQVHGLLVDQTSITEVENTVSSLLVDSSTRQSPRSVDYFTCTVFQMSFRNFFIPLFNSKVEGVSFALSHSNIKLPIHITTIRDQSL